MSLNNVAQHLASQGRHGDTMLVHMNPNEVAGLQALAEQKGTSLTTNPDTGMPEAFGLGDLNPFRIVQGKGEIGESGLGSLLIGAALTAAGVPPQIAGLMTGGATLAMGGNLGQAVGQGLGAYGGASMASGAGWGKNSNPGAVPVADAGTAVPPAAAAPIAAPAPTSPPPGYFDNTMTAAENKVSPTQAANQVATTTPAPAEATSAPTKATDIGFGPGNYAPGAESSTLDKAAQFAKEYKWPLAGAAALALTQQKPKGVEVQNQDPGLIRPYIYDPKTQGLTALKPVKAPGYSGGGLPIEQMSNANAIGQNTGYPQADILGHAYSSAWQTPTNENVVQGAADTGVDRITGDEHFAAGGITSLGGYAAGGNPHLLKGPGDGMSDNIPAVIGNKQPARLADGEFVVPADVVSHLGNGSTDAGAKQLYKMMDRIRQQRTGKKRQAPEVNPTKSMPA